MRLILGILIWLFVALSSEAADQVFLGNGIGDAGNSTSSYFLLQETDGGISTTLGDHEVPMPTAGTFHTLVVEIQNAPNTEAHVDEQSAVFALMVNGSATVLSCSIVEEAVRCCNAGDDISVVAGDLVAWRYIGTQIDPPGGPTSTIGGGRLSIRFTPTTTDETILLGGSGTGNIMGLNRDYILPLHGDGFNGTGLLTGDADEANGEVIFPVSGTLKSFYLHSRTSASCSSAMVFTVRQNGVNTSLGCTMTVGGTDCSNTVDSITISTGDGVTVDASIACAFPHNPFFPEWSVVFVPDSTGVFPVPSSTYDTTLLTTDTSYVAPTGAVYATGSSELVRSSPGQICTFNTLQTESTFAPDNGAGTQSYTITLRENAVDTGVSCTISETSTTCTDADSITSTALDRLSYSVVPSGTPTATAIRVSLVGSACSDEGDPCPLDGDWGWTHRP